MKYGTKTKQQMVNRYKKINYVCISMLKFSYKNIMYKDTLYFIVYPSFPVPTT